MANLNVRGSLKENENEVLLPTELLDYENHTTLASLSSVTTGTKDFSMDISSFRLLMFTMYNSDSGGWITTIMPTSVFRDLCNKSSMGIWCEQNMSTTNRRCCFVYVSDTQYNIRYIQNCNQIRIFGLKNHS